MGRNINPDIEAALEEGRAAGLREAAAYLRGLREVYVPYVVRGMSSAFHDEEGPDGWATMSSSLKKQLDGAARGVLRLINHDDVPPCEHKWGSEPPICVVCGELKSALAMIDAANA